MTRARRAMLAVALAACSAPPAHAPAPAPSPPLLAALPHQAAVDTGRFSGVVVCVRCHAAGDHVAMRDARGADVSPVADVAASMMGLAARDPYYLAALRRELHARPDQRDAILALCVRCHAPVGFAEAAAGGVLLGLGQLEHSDTPAAALGREGIACAGCHAIVPDGLGTEATFVGKLALRTDRVSYGALPAPLGDAMIQMVKTTPVPAPHVTQSRLCASCHTVLVHALGGGDEVAEQATYLEWRDSELQDEAAPGPRARTCQGCHFAAGEPTAFSTRPPDAPVRSPYVRHAVRGGSAYLLARLAEATAWLGAPTTPAALTAAARDTEAFLATAAELRATFEGELRVEVHNLTGHKLPTGYPTRRMWLHVAAYDRAGAVVFESGAHARGALIGTGGRRLDGPGVILPHRDRIAAPDEVALWEAVAVDTAGARTHLLLGTARFAKDDRILPAGWRADHADGARTHPIGVDGDRDFLAGSDTATFALPEAAVRAEIELLYQAIPPETLESYRPGDSPEAARFLAIASAPPSPQTLARARVARSPSSAP